MAENIAEESTEAFSARLTSIVTKGFISLAVSFGIHTGLFDALIDLHDSEKTSQEIADAAGLKERYVREWLGVMVVAHIVDVNPETDKYRLPPHRVPCFTKGSNATHPTVLATAIPMFCEVYNKLAECVTKDGPSGLPYSDYTQFHAWIAGFSSMWLKNYLIQEFVPSMPKLQQKLESGIRILDLGCGSGCASLLFAENYPNSSVVGLDFSKESTDAAREEARQKNLTNVEFVCCDAAAMPQDWSNTIDYIFTYDCIHDISHADRVLQEVHRILKPGGTFSMLEPDAHSKHADNVHNENVARLYTISLFHCLPVSLYFDGSIGLGTAWGREKATKMVQDCGMGVEAITNLPDTKQIHYICSKER